MSRGCEINLPHTSRRSSIGSLPNNANVDAEPGEFESLESELACGEKKGWVSEVPFSSVRNAQGG
jgi:hypothetical protein